MYDPNNKPSCQNVAIECTGLTDGIYNAELTVCSQLEGCKTPCSVKVENGKGFIDIRPNNYEFAVITIQK